MTILMPLKEYDAIKYTFKKLRYFEFYSSFFGVPKRRISGPKFAEIPLEFFLII
jgi:hypothetical protein